MIGRPADENTLSRKPSQIRNRIRRAKKRGDTELVNFELSLLHEIGYKPVSEWDIEELAHGTPRGKDGKFHGISPPWMTDSIMREVKKQLHRRTFGKLTANIELAIQVVTDLMTSQEVDDKGKPIVDARTRLAAAQFVIEHVIGKPAAILPVDAADQVRQMFAAAIVLDDGRQDTHLPVIEGRVVSEDDEEEE
jgi:hypothetical protein